MVEVGDETRHLQSLQIFADSSYQASSWQPGVCCSGLVNTHNGSLNFDMKSYVVPLFQ